MDNSIDTAREDLRNRTRGVLSEMTARLSDQGAPDWILEERVRSNLGRIADNTRAVDVRADGGHIYLSGPVLRHQRDAILKAASRTRGVYGVEDELQLISTHPVNTPADIPERNPVLRAACGSASIRRYCHAKKENARERNHRSYG